MTRINCVPVEELSLQHALAEYREMPRIRHLEPDRHKGKLPATYRMGKGHQIFFLGKGLYLMRRHRELIAYLTAQGYRLTLPALDLAHWPDWAMQDWVPDEGAMMINRQRIRERTRP
jgi:hypothetical protein